MNAQEVQVQHNRRHEYGADVEEHCENDTNGAIFLKTEEMPVKFEGVSYGIVPSQVQVPGKKLK